MGDHYAIFRGAYLTVVSLPPVADGSCTDVRSRRTVYGMDSRAPGQNTGRGSTRSCRPLGQVLAVPSCGRSQRAVFTMAIKRIACRKTDFADPRFRTPSRVSARSMGRQVFE